MPSVESILILGDISKIPSRDLGTVLKATQPHSISIYPRHSESLTDEELAAETEKGLIAVGILTPPRPVICRDEEERVSKIMEELPKRRNGERIYIVDAHPEEFVQAVKKDSNPNKDALKSATLLVTPASFHIDHLDPDIGIRIVSFPDTPYPYPIHPTPAS